MFTTTLVFNCKLVYHELAFTNLVCYSVERLCLDNQHNLGLAKTRNFTASLSDGPAHLPVWSWHEKVLIIGEGKELLNPDRSASFLSSTSWHVYYQLSNQAIKKVHSIARLIHVYSEQNDPRAPCKLTDLNQSNSSEGQWTDSVPSLDTIMGSAKFSILSSRWYAKRIRCFLHGC